MQSNTTQSSSFPKTPVLTRIPVAPPPPPNPEVVLKELELEAVALTNLHKRIFDQVRRLAVEELVLSRRVDEIQNEQYPNA